MRAKVQAAFETRLANMSGVPAVAWPNFLFQIVRGIPWLETYLLPAGERNIGVGPATVKEQSGIYQISAYYPASASSQQGSAAANTMVDLLKDRFPPGLVLTNAGVTIEVLWSSDGPADAQVDWYVIPVTVAYRAWI